MKDSVAIRKTVVTFQIEYLICLRCFKNLFWFKIEDFQEYEVQWEISAIRVAFSKRIIDNLALHHFLISSHKHFLLALLQDFSILRHVCLSEYRPKYRSLVFLIKPLCRGLSQNPDLFAKLAFNGCYTLSFLEAPYGPMVICKNLLFIRRRANAFNSPFTYKISWHLRHQL